jgi:hypothetical protein
MLPVLRGAAALTALIALTVTAGAAGPPPASTAASVATLIKKLDADSFRTRQRADSALRAMGPAVLPYVREELARTRSFEVRHRLQLIEGHLTAGDRISALVHELGHSDKRIARHADQTLRNNGPAVVPLLKKELNDGMTAKHRQRLEKIIDDLSETSRR